jgi:hypothetical protein
VVDENHGLPTMKQEDVCFQPYMKVITIEPKERHSIVGHPRDVSVVASLWQDVVPGFPSDDFDIQ